MSHDEVLAALKPNPMYAGVGVPPIDHTSTAMTHVQGQTRQDQSQATTECNTNTVDVVEVSDHDQTGLGQSLAITEARNPSYGTGQIDSMQSPLYKVVEQIDSMQNPLYKVVAAVVTSDHDNQYEDIDKQHNQTGQVQSQAITESNTTPQLP
uniref:Uncharacterized protein n=1 Tax=Branchiostoma floridae TaxID=7739 RepID=C3YFX3_BRAFL|eukprot:XP_002604768.1 hypothetical protein BRAFLDRAFT_70617 [Branchiostoma floridae]